MRSRKLRVYLGGFFWGGLVEFLGFGFLGGVEPLFIGNGMFIAIGESIWRGAPGVY